MNKNFLWTWHCSKSLMCSPKALAAGLWEDKGPLPSSEMETTAHILGEGNGTPLFSSSFPVLLPGKSHGQRSLVGCGPWGCKESDTTEQLPFHFSLSCIGEGNGNPLLCSCLENPRDGGVCWAAAYGVTQSQTRLK